MAKKANDKENSKFNFKSLTLILLFLNIIVFIILGSLLVKVNVNIENLEEEKEDNQNKIKMEENNKSIVLVKTNKGDFKIKLYLNESPITAGNFKKLVEEGFYDGTRFHRVIEGFMIQGGDPKSKNTSLQRQWGTGGPGYSIKDEFIKGLSNTVGTLSMANSGPNSGGSQFFINVADNTYLDWDKQPSQSKHPVFGEIIEGMDLIMEISQVKTVAADRPAQDVIILKAEMIEE